MNWMQQRNGFILTGYCYNISENSKYLLVLYNTAHAYWVNGIDISGIKLSMTIVTIPWRFAQSAGVVEYTHCTSAEGQVRQLVS